MGFSIPKFEMPKWNAPAGPNQQYGTTSSGVGTMRSGTIVSVTSKRPVVSASTSRALAARLAKEAKSRNTQLEAVMKRQRDMQAGLMKKAREAIKTQGADRRQEIGDNATKRKADADQSLTSRGLGNTTIKDSVSRGIDSSADRAVTQQGDLEAGRMAQTFEREAGMQLPEGQFQMKGVNSMGGGLEDYISMFASVGGGIPG